MVLNVVLSNQQASHKYSKWEVPSSSAQLFLPTAGLVAFSFLLGIVTHIPGCALDSGKLKSG